MSTVKTKRAPVKLSFSWAYFKRFLPAFSPSNQFVALSFESDFLKVVHARLNAGKMIVESVSSLKLEKKSDDENNQLLIHYLNEQKLRDKHIFCILSAKQFISKNVDIPSTELEELTKIINLQAGRFTPYSRDEIVIDFLSMGTPSQHYTSVLLFIVNRKVTDRYFRIFDSAGLHIDKIAVASEGMGIAYDEMAETEKEIHAIAGIYIAEDSSELTVMDRGQIVFVRSLPVGAAHFWSQGDSAQTSFLDELNKSLAAYQDQGVGRPIKFVVVTGLTERLDFLKDAIKSAVHLSADANTSIRVLDYRKYFELTAEASKELQAQNQFSFFELMSYLKNFGKTKINLIPQEIKLKRRVQEGGKEIINLGILLMSIMLLTSLLLANKIYFKTYLGNRLEKMNNSVIEEARSLQRISAKNRVIKKLLENRGKGLAALNIVSQFITTDLYLSQFSYEPEGKLTLGGTAESMSRVFAFVTQLNDSNYFKSVKTKETKSRKEGKNEVADFELECILAQGV